VSAIDSGVYDAGLEPGAGDLEPGAGDLEPGVAGLEPGAAAALSRVLRGAARRPGTVLAALYVLLILVCVVVPSLLTSQGPNTIVPADKLLAPSLAHPFGTDWLGRDMLARMVYACRPSIVAMVIAVGIGTVGGLSIGVVSGFLGGWVDAVLMRTVDVVLAIPGLLLALAIVTAIGFGTVHVSMAVGVGIIPGFARITRAQVLRIRSLPYVEAARTNGATLWRVLWRYVLPNAWHPVAVLIAFDCGTAILSIAALSYLGFGPQPPTVDLGTLVALGQNYLATSPWLSLFPGLAVGLLVFALNHLAKTLEDQPR
jgi:peptide/nickel transport system permease protein